MVGQIPESRKKKEKYGNMEITNCKYWNFGYKLTISKVSLELPGNLGILEYPLVARVRGTRITNSNDPRVWPMKMTHEFHPRE